MTIAQTLTAFPGAAPMARRSTPAVEFELIETTAGLTALGPEWNDLFDRTAEPTQVFQTHGFAEAWTRTYLDAPDGPAAGVRLAILIARHDERLVMVWPLVAERTLGLDVLCWLGAPIAQYGDVLVEPGPQSLDLLLAAWAQIRARLKPDVVRLRKVRADAAVAPALARLDTIQTGREEAASVALGSQAGAVTTASFEDRQSAKARKNRRRLLRRLEDHGQVRFQALPPSTAASALAVAGLALKRRWLDNRGLVSVAFADQRIERFFADVAGATAEPTGCQVFALDLDGVPVAVAIGFVCGPRLTLHMIAYDLDVEKSGVGVLNLEAILRWAERHGCNAVDLLAPKADYKMDWADTTVPVCDHAVPVTLKGQGCVRLYDGFLRPQAKSAIEALPASLRRRIAGHVG